MWRKKINNQGYLLFKYLWILIIMPKSVQFLLLGLLVIYLFGFGKLKLKIDKVAICIFIYATIHVLSILINTFTIDDTNRILAAFNTALIWILASFLFMYYRQANLNFKKVGKYMLFNMVILIGLSLLMVILMRISYQNGLTAFSRTLYSRDWFQGEATYRFLGFMEYSNLVVMFYLVCLPFSLHYLMDKISKNKICCYLILTIIPVWMTNSRMGIFLALIVVALSIFTIIDNKNKKWLLLMLPVCLVLLIINGGEFLSFMTKITDFVDGRAGSTNMRFYLYRKSLSMTMEKSPIWGMGIKLLENGYPLGSHCTYIGFIYKSGLAGTIFALIALISLNIQLVKKIWHYKRYRFFIWFLIGFLAACCLEDMDGANWLLAIYFSSAAMCLQYFGNLWHKGERNVVKKEINAFK